MCAWGVNPAVVRHLRKSREGRVAVPSAGFLNMDSTHVQFFRVRRLEMMFLQCGFTVLERRARTLLCGPYVDLLFRLAPFAQALCRANNRLADALPVFMGGRLDVSPRTSRKERHVSVNCRGCWLSRPTTSIWSVAAVLR